MNHNTKCECPYPNNYDCICRQGLYCGGYVGWAGCVPDECPHYKPLTISELLKVETRLLNDCESCPKYRSCYGGHTDADHCKVHAAIDVIRKLQRRVTNHKRSVENVHKTTSGVTYTGKETK